MKSKSLFALVALRRLLSLAIATSAIATETSVAETIRVPDLPNSSTPGNRIPFHADSGRSRYQQIYDASAFSGGGVIERIRFRGNTALTSVASATVDLTLKLAYSARSVTEASVFFEQNIGPGQITLIDGPTEFSISPKSGGDFNVELDLPNRFSYDPSRGDLLLEAFVRSTEITDALFDFGFDSTQGIQQTATQRIYSTTGFGIGTETSGRVGVAGGVPAPLGLLTEFVLIVPEPGPAAIGLSCLALLLGWRCNREF